MLRLRIICFLLALCCAFPVISRASAAQVDSGSVYCFTAGDFPEAPEGICITGVPDREVGLLMLGDRILRPGDILTAEQLAQMTFCPVGTEEDTAAEVTYLPVINGHVETGTVWSVEVRGREDLAPAAEDFALETYKNLPIEGALKVRDPEGGAMTFAVTRQPRRGSVTVSDDGTFVYTPKKNKVGVDSFRYTATDASGNVSREATVTVTILKPTAAQYTDTVGESCRFAAEWMKNTGIFVGEQVAENLCFQPDKQVSRGEFITMLVRALDIPGEDSLADAGLADAPRWMKPYLAAAVRSGLTAGLPREGEFSCDGPITGAEAAVLIQNALDLTARELAAEEEELPAWAADAITTLSSYGIRLAAGEALTRADAAQVLYRAFCLMDEAPGIRVLGNRN